MNILIVILWDKIWYWWSLSFLNVYERAQSVYFTVCWCCHLEFHCILTFFCVIFLFYFFALIGFIVREEDGIARLEDQKNSQ